MTNLSYNFVTSLNSYGYATALHLGIVEAYYKSVILTHFVKVTLVYDHATLLSKHGTQDLAENVYFDVYISSTNVSYVG